MRTHTAVDEFAFGLDTVLDGFAARVAGRTVRKGRRARVSGEQHGDGEQQVGGEPP